MIEQKLKNSPIVYYINKNIDRDRKWLMFMHAAFVTHEMFNKQIEYFKNSYNIIAVDIIGHGKSLAIMKGDSIDKMSGWMKEILDKQQIDKINLLGISLGTVISQDFANKYPDKIESLACFGGYDINNFDKNIQKSNRAVQVFMMIKALFSIKWFAKANKKISAYTEKAQNECYRMNLQFPKKSFMNLASLNGMVNKQQTKIRNYHLLIGCGAYDDPMAFQAAKMWHDTEPNSQMIIFENAGHCVNMDVPDVFNTVMESFWNGKLVLPDF